MQRSAIKLIKTITTGMEINNQEELMVCPSCGEESFVAVHRRFNIMNCQHCDYFLIVYLDEAGKAWTREPGVLEPDPIEK